jgi:peptidoglycan/LPS O-acetylase OafA/YrhL
MATNDTRLVEVDALRGVAALAVVLFHYTTQFGRLFHPAEPTSVAFDHGHYGVNLFFIISGFVIFMTLARTRTAGDFIVSRLSRLYPAYWLAVVLTFVVTHQLGLPGKLVSASSAAANALMFHGLFRVPHVDGVYWTLEVELLFYAGMLALFALGRLRQVFLVAIGLMALRWVYWALARWAGIDLPYIAWRLMILAYLPWFVLGLAVYTVTQAKADALLRRHALAASAVALLTLAVTEPAPQIALLAIGLGGLVLLAAQGRLPVLRLPPLVWLGRISYSLYLLHENIGWAVMLRLTAAGWSTDAAALAALLLSLLLADAVTRWVEQPAMGWIRRQWKQRQLQRNARAAG